MRSEKILAISFILLVNSLYPAFSMTPEQCRAAAESCMRDCTGVGDPIKVTECRDRCNSPLHGPCAGAAGASGASANKGPVGPAKGTRPIVASPPSSAGVNKGSSGGSTTTLEKSNSGKH
jgi:hypothetical protein